jgi:hypothetical protein
MAINFVSISAVSDKNQLEKIAKIYHREKISFPLAIGYQVSHKSINKGTQNTRQPKFSDLEILDKQTRDYGFFTAIHYYTKNNSAIIEDLEKIIDSGIDSSLALLQFNTLPPSIDILKDVKEMGFKVIFKIAVADRQNAEGGYAVWKGKEVQDALRGEVNPLINQVLDRKDFIDYAMFDPSHGTNLNLNLNGDSLAIKFGKIITSNPSLKKLGLVYAGGIKPSNIKSLIKSLNYFFPKRISFDIESGVRTNDSLDLNLVKDYLIECKENILK